MARPLNRGRTARFRLTALGLLALVAALNLRLAASPAAAATPTHDPFLEGLAGRWTMTGRIHGKPVSYCAVGSWVLGDGWLRLALTDRATSPAYEADVFFSPDTTVGDYVVHWLDRFGGPGARVVGNGRRAGQTLVFEFPYDDARFRDTLTLSTDHVSGTLLIESQTSTGVWSTFASYTLARDP